MRTNSKTTGPKLVGQNAFASIHHRIEGAQVRIGSAADNDLIVSHRSVSGRHALIQQTRGRYYIRDLGSTNGTFLNGERIATEQPLRPGDEVRFGAARFAMVAGAKPAASRPAYFGIALGLLLLAVAGYLAVEFVRNWENLEQLASTAPNVAASISSSAVPTAALTGGASGARSNPSAPNTEIKPSAPMAEVKPPAVTGPPPAWLAAINQYRAGVDLPPVAEDPKLSDGDHKHAIYVVKNYEDKVGPNHLLAAAMHDEDKDNSWYSPEGEQAGANSDVNQLWGPEASPSPLWAINFWLDGPFHRLWILNSRLHRVGYGEFCEKKYCVAALDLGSGADQPHEASPLAAPIVFPPDKSITSRNSFSGEWPSPLTSCAGYTFPAGLAATIQLGSMVDAKLSSYQVARDGNPIESCGIDATNYENPVSAEQDRGRSILRELGAVIIIPRDPLLAGQYSVSATINNHPYQWSFTVAPKSTTAMNLPSKLPGKDKLEAALRGAEAIAKKADSEGRAEYARTVATANAARATAAAKLREFQRRRGSAFLEGPGPVSAADAGQWLAELNRDRAAVGLTPVAEDPALSDGDLKHAKYVAINYPIQAALGAELHSEDPSKPGYTPEGKTAAGQSNVAPYWYPPLFPAPSTPSVAFLNAWLAAPFHRASILYPELHRVGFGQYCQDHACGAALDASESLHASPDPTAFAQPVFFPPQKYPIALVELEGEWPDPATACPGYTWPVGLPITIQLGTNFDAKLSSYALTQDSKPVEACGYDSTTYVNPSPADQQRARQIMHWNGEVVIVPRKPLERAATYQVSTTVNDHPYQWSFTVSR